MARTRTVLICAAVAASFLFCAAPSYAGSGVSAVVTFTKGKVQVQPAGARFWNDTKMGQFIYEGDTLRTGPGSRAGITFTGGIENRLNANTTFKVEPAELANRGEGNKIQMLFGKVWTKILRKGTKFQIHTPVAVCSVRGTEYETDVGDKGRTEVKVYDGEVEFSNEYGSKTLNKNSKSSCDAGSPPGDPVPLGGGDKENWQDEMNTSGSLKIELSVTELSVGVAADGTVTAFDKKGKKDDKYAKIISLSSDNSNIDFAPAGSESWSSKLEQEPAGGTLAFKVKAVKYAGNSGANITASGENLGASMINASVKKVALKNLKVRVKTAEGQEKELLLKFKTK